MDEFETAKSLYAAGEYEKAIELLEPLAEQGMPQAQVMLGTLFHLALGTERDMERAALLYELAQEQGLSIASSNLGALIVQSFTAKCEITKA